MNFLCLTICVNTDGFDMLQYFDPHEISPWRTQVLVSRLRHTNGPPESPPHGVPNYDILNLHFCYQCLDFTFLSWFPLGYYTKLFPPIKFGSKCFSASCWICNFHSGLFQTSVDSNLAVIVAAPSRYIALSVSGCPASICWQADRAKFTIVRNVLKWESYFELIAKKTLSTNIIHTRAKLYKKSCLPVWWSWQCHLRTTQDWTLDEREPP